VAPDAIALGTPVQATAGPPLSLFALAITAGLILHNARIDQPYDALVV
jgi:hypothetical protein